MCGTCVNTRSAGPAALGLGTSGFPVNEAQSALPCKLLRDTGWEAVSLHSARPNTSGGLLG